MDLNFIKVHFSSRLYKLIDKEESKVPIWGRHSTIDTIDYVCTMDCYRQRLVMDTYRKRLYK